MRVVCIDDSCQPNEDIPKVKKGSIYNVLRIIGQKTKKIKNNGFVNFAGDYYVLVECGGEVAYHYSLFILINEDQQDEKEMQRDYNKSINIFS